MKKIALFSFMVVAVLGMMTTRAWCSEWYAQVNIANSGESPVQLSLINNDQAKAQFPGGSGGPLILQPGQSTYLKASWDSDSTENVQWNIIYNFYDGTDSINQRISSDGTLNVNCASASQSGMFSVSAGTFVDYSFPNYDIGAAMASWMGLSGTDETIVASTINFLLILAGEKDNPPPSIHRPKPVLFNNHWTKRLQPGQAGRRGLEQIRAWVPSSRDARQGTANISIFASTQNLAHFSKFELPRDDSRFYRRQCKYRYSKRLCRQLCCHRWRSSNPELYQLSGLLSKRRSSIT